MTPRATGWTLGAAALGMMCTLLAVDVSQMTTWQEVFTPSFIGSSMAHVGTVIAAFIGGKLIPTTITMREVNRDRD